MITRIGGGSILVRVRAPYGTTDWSTYAALMPASCSVLHVPLTVCVCDSQLFCITCTTDCVCMPASCSVLHVPLTVCVWQPAALYYMYHWLCVWQPAALYYMTVCMPASCHTLSNYTTVMTVCITSLVPRPAPVLHRLLQAIKNLSRGKPGNEASRCRTSHSKHCIMLRRLSLTCAQVFVISAIDNDNSTCTTPDSLHDRHNLHIPGSGGVDSNLPRQCRAVTWSVLPYSLLW